MGLKNTQILMARAYNLSNPWNEFSISKPVHNEDFPLI